MHFENTTGSGSVEPSGAEALFCGLLPKDFKDSLSEGYKSILPGLPDREDIVDYVKDLRDNFVRPAHPEPNSLDGAFDKLLLRLHADAGSRVTKSQLDDVFKAKDLDGAELGIVCALRSWYSKIASGDDGISRMDVHQLQQKQSKLKGEETRLAEIEKLSPALFKALDKDGSGILSKEKLSAAEESLSDPALAGQLHNSLRYIRKHFEQIQKANCDLNDSGISIEDLQKFAAKRRLEPDEQTRMLVSINRSMANATDSAISMDLFANKANPLDCVKADAVRQGHIGDCYFLSPLAALAEAKPEAIVSMLKKNDDNTYTVTFPGRPEEAITVAAPGKQELMSYAHGSKYGIWPAVIEKAYGAYISKSPLRRNLLNNPFGGGDLQSNADGGARFQTALSLLTGGEAGVIDLDKAADSKMIEDSMKAAVEKQMPMTSWRWGDATGKKDYPGLVSGHEYSLLGFDSATHSVIIRNPWGEFEPVNAWGSPADGKNDGVFKMPVDEFKKHFDGFAIATKGPPGYRTKEFLESIFDTKLPNGLPAWLKPKQP